VDEAAIMMMDSGGGKSPLIMKVLLSELVSRVDAVEERVPGGLASVLQASTNWCGWRDVVPQLGYRSLFFWEELFMGVKKMGEASDRKMSLEDLIRIINPLATSGGDLRGSKDAEIKSETKSSLISGLQYSTMHEYLGGDSKGALERLTFYLSSAQKAKDTKQQQRNLACVDDTKGKADRSSSMRLLRAMLGAHVRAHFPPEVQAQFVASLQEAEEGDEPEEGRPKKKRRKSQPAPPAPPPSGLVWRLHEKCSRYADTVADEIRSQVPMDLATHPIFAQFLKWDQSLLRTMALKAMRREALTAVLRREEGYQPSFVVHPADAVRAERAARARLCMRLAIYNELRKHRPRGPEVPIPVSSERGFHAMLQKILRTAEQKQGELSYAYPLLRYWPHFARMSGWLLFLEMMQRNGLLAAVQQDGAWAPVTADTRITTTVGYNNRDTAPSVKIKVDELRQLLERNLEGF
ncbi:unnamed protein product, partial [Effrenium voratum]